jgi:hypothetical protein
MKTVGYWAYWLFLYGIATIPAGFFAALMASSYIYVSNHAHRPRLNEQAYMTVLNGEEIGAAFVCAAPGFVWVGWSQLKERRKEWKKLQKQQPSGIEDNAVWPPSPRE